MEVKVNVNIELGQTTINALAGILGGAVVTAKAAVVEAPAEEKEKTPAKVASKPAAKPAPKAVEEEEAEEEAKPVAAKPAPKAVEEEEAKPVAAKAKPVAEEEDFNELDEDAQLEAIKKEVTKHTKKGKTSDIKQLLGLFDVGRASDLDPATYGEFFELVKRYSGGEGIDAIVESFAV